MKSTKKTISTLKNWSEDYLATNWHRPQRDHSVLKNLDFVNKEHCKPIPVMKTYLFPVWENYTGKTLTAVCLQSDYS